MQILQLEKCVPLIRSVDSTHNKNCIQSPFKNTKNIKSPAVTGLFTLEFDNLIQSANFTFEACFPLGPSVMSNSTL